MGDLALLISQAYLCGHLQIRASIVHVWSLRCDKVIQPGKRGGQVGTGSVSGIPRICWWLMLSGLYPMSMYELFKCLISSCKRFSEIGWGVYIWTAFMDLIPMFTILRSI